MRRSAITTSALVALFAIAGTAYAQRAGQGEDEAATFVEVGRKALLRKDYDEAQKALEQARALNSRRIEAYVLLSAVYAARKQYAKGVELMRQAQALAPEDPEVLLALGSDLVLAGDPASGVPLLQAVVAKEPARYDAQQLLGHYFHDNARWPEAIAAYEAYFAHRPPALANEDATHQIDLADSYLRGRKPKEALALFQRAALRGGRSELRARIGVAWATAAIDCKRARALLHELEPVAEQHPEIWLVDGQCALSLGDTAGALAAGRRYLAGAPNASPTTDHGPRADGALAQTAATAAAGHALVGQADAARGDLNEARSELETARKLEPARRRWTVQLAMVLRRAGHAGEAIDALEKLGPPPTPPVDRDWWIELGEALLARGDAGPAASRLAPVAPELPGDAAFRTVLGAAQLGAGQLDAAVKTLDEAEGIESTPRSRKLLAEALVRVAVGKLSADGAAAAEPMLVRAVELDPSPVALRDLGIARLALGKPADAVPVLE
ncbi:MAG TPA: tetratricopeptide repeat protein, partial [Kofleriaceae bacterium]|nr:tetratricopeptide repeat protein [Kofleriaceae bacterium]